MCLKNHPGSRTTGLAIGAPTRIIRYRFGGHLRAVRSRLAICGYLVHRFHVPTDLDPEAQSAGPVDRAARVGSEERLADGRRRLDRGSTRVPGDRLSRRNTG